ncbi:hypothetical protein [Aureimonas sp. AU22]|uniref:hypothetical protein n=1 Tax=Aureimonas sp. AU22 TaxID=1638162 RepID=UPI000A65FBAB|nr:hypothetical protein [Aureimonas sp. AU22]
MKTQATTLRPGGNAVDGPMNILRFPDTSRTEDRTSGPAEMPYADAKGEAAHAVPDARILQSLSVLNRPILEAVVSRRPRAQDVLAAFRAEWTPPRLRMPRPANDVANT